MLSFQVVISSEDIIDRLSLKISMIQSGGAYYSCQKSYVYKRESEHNRNASFAITQELGRSKDL